MWYKNGTTNRGIVFIHIGGRHQQISLSIRGLLSDICSAGKGRATVQVLSMIDIFVRIKNIWYATRKGARCTMCLRFHDLPRALSTISAEQGPFDDGGYLLASWC